MWWFQGWNGTNQGGPIAGIGFAIPSKHLTTNPTQQVIPTPITPLTPLLPEATPTLEPDVYVAPTVDPWGVEPFPTAIPNAEEICTDWKAEVLAWIEQGNRYTTIFGDVNPDAPERMEDVACGRVSFPRGVLSVREKKNVHDSIEIGYDIDQLLPGLYQYKAEDIVHQFSTR